LVRRSTETRSRRRSRGFCILARHHSFHDPFRYTIGHHLVTNRTFWKTHILHLSVRLCYSLLLAVQRTVSTRSFRCAGRCRRRRGWSRTHFRRKCSGGCILCCAPRCLLCLRHRRLSSHRCFGVLCRCFRRCIFSVRLCVSLFHRGC